MEQTERNRIEQEVRAEVTRRVHAKMGFYWHAAVFALVNCALIAINVSYSPGTKWFQWPLGGWGAAIILHWMAVFPRSLGADMIDAEVQRELAKRGVK